MDISQPGDLVVLINPSQRCHIFRLQPDGEMQTHRGVVKHNDLINRPFGTLVKTHLGYEFSFYKPTLRDILLHTRRQSQIIFPKDIGYILLRLSAGPGARILEAGTGSGALTTALAWAVGDHGHIFSYDRRADMQELARLNLHQVDLEDRVTFRLQDISEGFIDADLQAVFLDVHDPHHYLKHVRNALQNGGSFGAILPTTGQVSALLEALELHHFSHPDVCEILLRFYKPVPDRLRPTDRMVAHTGYLVFARMLLETS